MNINLEDMNNYVVQWVLDLNILFVRNDWYYLYEEDDANRSQSGVTDEVLVFIGERVASHISNYSDLKTGKIVFDSILKNIETIFGNQKSYKNDFILKTKTGFTWDNDVFQAYLKRNVQSSNVILNEASLLLESNVKQELVDEVLQMVLTTNNICMRHLWITENKTKQYSGLSLSTLRKMTQSIVQQTNKYHNTPNDLKNIALNLYKFIEKDYHRTGDFASVKQVFENGKVTVKWSDAQMRRNIANRFQEYNNLQTRVGDVLRAKLLSQAESFRVKPKR